MREYRNRICSAVLAAVCVIGTALIPSRAVHAEDVVDPIAVQKQAAYDAVPETNGLENWPQGPHVYANSAIVMEMNSGAILYGKKINDKHYPASITKLLTALVALENADPDDEVYFSEDSVSFLEYGDASIGMRPGEILSMNDALYGMLLASANEVSYAIAESVGKKMGGGFETFIQKMNERCEELGCTGSHWTNANGLHDENHYTCCYDMALIARAAYQNETFWIIVGTARYTIPPTNKHAEQTDLQNHNEMLYPFQTNKYVYDGCTGGKTGYTNAANSTLVTYAERDGMTLICVVMNTQSPNQWLDSRNLFDYCFDNFQLFNIAENETNYTSAEQKNAGTLNTNEPFVDIDKDAGIVLPKTAEFSDATSKIVYDDVTNDTVGTIEYTYAGHEVGKADIVKTNVQVPEYKFSNQTDVSEEAQTEETEHVSKIQIRMSTIITVVVVVLVLLVLGIIIKKVADNFYIIKHNFEVRKEHKRLFKREKKRNKRRRRRR